MAQIVPTAAILSRLPTMYEIIHGQKKVPKNVASSQEQNGGFHLFLCDDSLILQKKKITSHAN